MAINIAVVEVINNEIICAGKNPKSGNVILVYGVYSNTGKLDLTIKSNSNEDI